MSSREKLFDVDEVAIFGRHMTAWRVHSDMSQRALALATNIDRGSICRFERGERQPTLTQVFVIADALGVTAGTLIDDTPRVGIQKGS